ncbi:glyoxalase/bleomycin resistance protein/dioxygenase superfamily protein [Streptomyces sp. 3211.6]|uniref:VOC family protein n=1 Tax=Streptomyces sp. 3211.6 TaxID=1938845 RepID=UPI000C2BBF3D|nr:VOC family protein [Streptomyces sp. 3211.6]RKT02508.1 glyoxalase/bleomycin resistance protein/dioxygenase superfamily protein [Streptomyces sp. 3211.6]
MTEEPTPHATAGPEGTGRQHGALHHVEIWVPDLERAAASFGWLLEALGYTPFQSWSNGRSWRLGAAYLVFEQSPALTAGRHDRCRPGLNHLAFHVQDHHAVEELARRASRHGWTLMFPDRHPHAGGERTYAAYLENADGFEVELVAITAPGPG